MSLAADALSDLQPATNPSNSNGPSSVVNASPCTSLLSSSSSCTSAQSTPQIRLLTRPASIASTVSVSKSDNAKQVLETSEIAAATPSAVSSDGGASGGLGQSVFDTANPSVNLHEFIMTTLQQQQKDRSFLLQLEQQLIDFVNDSEKTSARFPPMTSYHRMLVHRVSAYFGLEHSFDAVAKSVVITKTQSTKLPKQRFKEHFQSTELGPSVLPRAILKRMVNDSAPASESSSKTASVTEERPTKSIEEREAEYEQRRARIFNQPAGRLTPPSTSTSVAATLTSHSASSFSQSGLRQQSPQVSGLQQQATQPSGLRQQSGLLSAPSSVMKPQRVTYQRQPVGPPSSAAGQKVLSPATSGVAQRQTVQQSAGFAQTHAGASHMSVSSANQPSLPLQQQAKRSDSVERRSNIEHGHQETRRSDHGHDFTNTLPSPGTRTGSSMAGWTQAGPGVLVEQRTGSCQESKLSAQMSDMSLSKSSRKDSTGKYSGSLHGSYVSTGRGPEPSFVLGNYPGLPLPLQTPPGSGIVMYPGHMRAPFQTEYAIPHGATPWSTGTPKPELTPWLGQHQDVWSSQLRPLVAGHIRPPLLNLQHPMTVLEVYDLPANLPIYETDVLLEELKLAGASLQYQGSKIWALFRARADAQRALETPFQNFKVRMARLM